MFVAISALTLDVMPVTSFKTSPTRSIFSLFVTATRLSSRSSSLLDMFTIFVVNMLKSDDAASIVSPGFRRFDVFVPPRIDNILDPVMLAISGTATVSSVTGVPCSSDTHTNT